MRGRRILHLGGWVSVAGYVMVAGCFGCSGATDPVHESPATAGTPYADVWVGSYAVCALDFSGFLSCWGAASADAPLSTAMTAFDLSDEHACGVTPDGSGLCWAWLDGIGADEEYRFLTPPDGRFVEVAVSSNSTCWLTETGLVVCAGEGADEFAIPPSPLHGIEGGGGTYCARDTGNRAHCWGSDLNGKYSSLPDAPYSRLDVGGTVCAIKESDRSAVCTTNANPADWDGDWNPGFPWFSEGPFVDVAGNPGYCTVSIEGEVACLVDFNACDVPGDSFVAVSSEFYMNCAAKADAGVLCWMADPFEPEDHAPPCLIGDPADLPVDWSE